MSIYHTPDVLDLIVNAHSAQGKGAFAMVPSCMTFIPIAKATPAAGEIYQRLKDTINAGIASNSYSNGLQKQYQILLKKIEQGQFFCETVLAQGFTTGPCELTATITTRHFY